MSQYIYKNIDDTKRVVISDVVFDDVTAKKEWNCDLWTRNSNGEHSVETYSESAGEYLPTRRMAKEYAIEMIGSPIKSIRTDDYVTEGWE